jgi:single-stranded-DNA-specific exonuclease
MVVAELLAARGIATAADAARFLEPAFDQLEDPYRMLGMRAAVERTERAIAAGETILLYGDYDVDGTVAVVLLQTAIEMLGGRARYHVPHRLREGYGMQSAVLREAALEGVGLVISVDTGMRAHAEAEAARELGLDLIITDHHLPDDARPVPHGLAVLNPNQPGCEYPAKHLCGAGVAFKLAQALLEARDRGRARAKILPSFLKLLALATVADSVPLLGENRVFVALGLEGLSRPAGAGLRALLGQAGLGDGRGRLTAADIGFRLGPRINAAGRMDVAAEVVELFTTRDHGRALELAEKLEGLNTARRAAEQAALVEIEALLEAPDAAERRIHVLEGRGWHRGVIGILASRVVERTALPAIVIACEDGKAYGSGRSIAGFHLLQAIESCAHLFERFGGHAHAVGFAMEAERCGELRRLLEEHAERHLGGREPAILLDCHAELPLDRVTPALYGWVRRLEPMGMGNPEPLFAARRVRVAAAPRVMREKHVRLELAQGARGRGCRAVGWNLAARVSALGLAEGSLVNLAYRLRENDHPEFGGLELELAGIERAEE